MGLDPNLVLLQEPPFTAGPGEMFAVAVTHVVRRLRLIFPRYDEFLTARGLRGEVNFENLADLDRLPPIFLPILKAVPFAVPSGLTIV